MLGDPPSRNLVFALHRADALTIIGDSYQASLFEPEKPNGQLPEIIPGVADRQLAGPPERIGGLFSEW